MPGPALHRLRDATIEHHAAVERAMQPERLGEHAHYVQVLRVFAAFHVVWDDAVARALPPHLGDWIRRRSRAPWLLRDLHYLRAGADLPAPDCPRFDNAAAALGSVYVMEGSALGGRVIAASLAASGLTPTTGAAYFNGWGASTGSMWKEFRQLLERELDGEEAAIASACRAACLTFDALTSLFEMHTHERPAFA
jgi:heme oxygenase